MADIDHAEQGFDNEKLAAKSLGRSGRLELELTEAAGLLLTWSILVIVEGAIRAVRNSYPEGGDLTPETGFPPLALLVGGVAEVIFGAVGIALALSILLFKMRNALMPSAFLIFQSVLGWFVFITYVLAEPLYKISKLKAGGLGFSLGEHRFLIFLGLVTSVAWCAALQAGQFILAARCMSMMKGKGDTFKMHKLRATVWSGFTALAGISMTVNAVIVMAKATGSSPRLPPAMPVFPPHVNVYAESILVCGIVTVIWGLLGVAGAVTSNKNLLRVFHLAWFPVFMLNVLVFGLILGRVPMGMLAFAAAQHTVLSFAFTVLPVVFTRKVVEWDSIGNLSSDE